MSSRTIAHNETRIKINCVGHHYYYDLTQNGNVIALNEGITRNCAIEIAQENNNCGTIPDKCNFDVCYLLSWN